ncbi:MAG: Gfo/Idh/MocA family protein [Planctomycetota bacterium]|jgi:predicted dehydrogenase
MNRLKGKNQTISRRQFLDTLSAAAVSVTIVPRHVLGGAGYIAPADKLNIACIGIGGKGRVDVEEVSSQNIVALCDVDEVQAAKQHRRYGTNAYERHPKARRYQDFRVMLDREKSIDAVTISTPDHTHAVIAMTAIKMGKHVFCQKPLTHTLHEARVLTDAAQKAGVATQMGIQGHANEGTRILREWVETGVIGTIRKVHCFTNRPIWPQGLARPTETPPVPDTLAWDLWLGPMPDRPYHPVYVPFGWRAWWDFGVGALGDMGCHIFDYPYWILDLDFPESVEAHSTAVNDETAPVASIIYYNFPAKGSRVPLKLIWYDGDMMPEAPEGYSDSLYRRVHSGVLFEGDAGHILYGHHAPRPILLPEKKFKDFQEPDKTIPRSNGHYIEWIEACKGGKPALCNFDFSGPLTEIVLLGNLAIRSGKKLFWDRKNMMATNAPEVSKYLHIPYRNGWELL